MTEVIDLGEDCGNHLSDDMLKSLYFNGYMCPSFSNRPNILYWCHDFGAYFNKRIRVRVVKKNIYKHQYINITCRATQC